MKKKSLVGWIASADKQFFRHSSFLEGNIVELLLKDKPGAIFKTKVRITIEEL
ncbi:MAG TPA: hypothetical protein VMZ91_13570 [Candidatus Paceibacterota bacterium]|nr:hypothetical protein [Candidatus Paceibacterota bacterium]